MLRLCQGLGRVLGRFLRSRNVTFFERLRGRFGGLGCLLQGLGLGGGFTRRFLARLGFRVGSGLFLAGYAIARLIGELFREPDEHLGFLLGGSVTMGQILSLPPLLFGAFLIWRALRKPPLPV